MNKDEKNLSLELQQNNQYNQYSLDDILMNEVLNEEFMNFLAQFS